MIVADEAAVEEVSAAGDVGAVVGGEKRGYASDFFGFAEAAKRDIGEKRVQLWLVGEQRCVDRCVDCSGSNVVDRDAEWPQLDAEVAHQHAHRAFAGAVGGEVREDHVFVDRGDVDDAAGLFGVAELAYEGLREEERAFEIDVHDKVVVGFGDVPEVGAFFYAGVVDENVAGAELLPGGVDERVAVGDAGDVGADHDGFATGRCTGRKGKAAHH